MIAYLPPFTLDTGQRRLSRDGQDVHLTPKAFDLLVLLVAEAPHVVAKADLHARLWPETYVSDATLVGLVKELRRAIDTEETSRVRTVHRIGYAWAGPVTLAPRDGDRRPRHWLDLGTRVQPLVEGETLIGRDKDAVVNLLVAGVSRRHARIVVRAHDASIEDLGSKNGTKIGGRAIEGITSLRDGDVIQVGPATVIYRTGLAELSTVTVATTLP